MLRAAGVITSVLIFKQSLSLSDISRSKDSGIVISATAKFLGGWRVGGKKKQRNSHSKLL